MANIVATDKFINPIYIDHSNAEINTTLIQLITVKERYLIDQVFGKKAVKFIYDHVPTEATLTVPATNTAFEVFYNGGYFTDTDGNDVYTEGVVAMLANFLYFYCAEKLNYIVNSTGAVSKGEFQVDNSEQRCEAWNRGVEISVTVSGWMLKNVLLFDEVEIEFTTLGEVNPFGL